MPGWPEDWIVPDWPAPAGVRALITTRNGGNSTGPYASMNLGTRVEDDPRAVEANRRLLGSQLPAEPRWLDQVHGVRVVNANSIDEPLRADGSFVRTAGIVCAVMVADCLPVLLADRAGRVVAAAHAGWRGLAAGIIENAVLAMDTAPEELIAYLGPAIGPSAFEVGDEVREAFLTVNHASDCAFRPLGEGKWSADLFLLARQRLAAAGLHNVFGGGQCTYSDPRRFFSHRRDKISGRMGALIWIAP